MDDLLARLNARISGFAESRDPGVALDPAALEEATQLWDAAQPAEGDPRAVSVDVLMTLAYLHMARYHALPKEQEQEELQTAIGFFRLLAGRAPWLVPDDFWDQLGLTRPESSRFAKKRAIEGVDAVKVYERTGRPELLDSAACAFWDAIAAAPPNDPHLAAYLSNLGGTLGSRYRRTGDALDLDAAIDAGRRAVATAAPGHDSLAAMMSNLGGSLLDRFRRSGDAADLDAAIGSWQGAVTLTPAGHPDLAGYLRDLGPALLMRFDRNRNAEDLDKAATAFGKLAAVTQPRHPELGYYLSGLGLALRTRFEQTGNAQDLDDAVDAGQRAVAATPPGRPRRAEYLSYLGVSLRTRFERAGVDADLDEAVSAYREAAAATPPDRPELAEYLSGLGVCLTLRFGETGDPAGLDEAVDVARRAVSATPPGDTAMARYLTNLGESLIKRFERAGDLADLDDAIDALRRAATITPPPPQHDLAVILSNLGDALTKRFVRAGDLADLDDAIDALRQAVASTQPDHPYRADYLSNLGSSLRARFDAEGDVADLDEAVTVLRDAVAATPPGHANKAAMLSNLGGPLLARFERRGAIADLNEAVTALRSAVAATPPAHPMLARHQSNLSIALRMRFDLVGDAADLDTAVDSAQRAVTVAPPGDPNLPGYLSSLGNSLMRRFERAGENADLEQAIRTLESAATTTPHDHPDLAVHLLNLGLSLARRSDLTGDPADMDAAIDDCERASQVPAGRSSIRLEAARNWGVMAARSGRKHQAAEGYAAAIGLLPLLAWHGLDRATREEQLARWAGLAADAAACAVQDGRPELAVELLERGRSVLWTQALNLRSDLSRLSEKAPDLATRLDGIRAILDAAVSETATLSPESAAGRPPIMNRARQEQDSKDMHRRLAREWDDILAQVRKLDGFEHFLAAIPYSELADAAAAGPVVIVNTSGHGCHALIVTSRSEVPSLVDLPDMSLNTAAEHASKMLTALANAADPNRPFLEREKDRHAILDVLDWLWDGVAEPVLATLGHTSPPKPGSPWPRVWWCPTGPLSILPIHAAGHHPRYGPDNRDIESVLHRVVSSYTPTLAALARARHAVPPGRVRQLTIGMPTTPGQPTLPAVPAELEVLARYFPPGPDHNQLAESQATRANVSAKIADHSWVHLACHARQEQTDPDRSGLALWDGTLTVTDLAALPTHGRDLAFLSACETATGSIRHLDEAIHLAAAMQFLGYRHVIATMWSIGDLSAPKIAESIYSALTAGNKPDPGPGAEALHHAIRALCQADPTNPLLWGSYIHLGP